MKCHTLSSSYFLMLCMRCKNARSLSVHFKPGRVPIPATKQFHNTSITLSRWENINHIIMDFSYDWFCLTRKFVTVWELLVNAFGGLSPWLLYPNQTTGSGNISTLSISLVLRPFRLNNHVWMFSCKWEGLCMRLLSGWGTFQVKGNQPS